MNKIITRLDEQVLRTLLYFDIFNYPLNTDEIYKFLGVPALDKTAISSSLNNLKDQKIIFQFGEFFNIKNDNASVTRRIKGNLEAEKYIALAHRKASFISKFPFARPVKARCRVHG